MPTDEAQRASPDALLALAKKEGRGHLKIFLGAAPGVGKTFAMLTSARTEKSGGRDVVAGLIETHGRRETEQLIEGFEALPRKPIVYRNQVMKEFDLDAALARRPGLLLVTPAVGLSTPAVFRAWDAGARVAGRIGGMIKIEGEVLADGVRVAVGSVTLAEVRVDRAASTAAD